MTESVGAYAAKTHLPALLARVADGEDFVITKNGKPVARLLPAESSPVEQVLADMLRFRASLGSDDLDIAELVNAGRRV